MHKLSFPAPAPPTLASAAEPEDPTCACAVCGAKLRGARALSCAQCACGPFHPACALPISVTEDGRHRKRHSRDGGLAQTPRPAHPSTSYDRQVTFFFN